MVRKDEVPTGPATNGPKLQNAADRANRLIYYAALTFVYLACAIFVAAAVRLFRAPPGASGLASFYPEILLCAIAVFAGLVGVSLLRSVGLATVSPGPVINPDEWAILSSEVKGGKEDAISQYIRLRSLSGFTGGFTMLGLTGLPLATIGLTLFFALMYAYSGDLPFMDLAKLTLGAFIGSFVQKQVGERQATGGVVELPSGEKLKVQSPRPPTIA
jgi:hypothetical protein